ncbi:receptor family ligand binding region domain-containing protein [Ditylenchus destructor]|uniref:Receptor family ligand binding region domain-containing protein n=1 Tax=Ditylenchus destructor TaxID=166010 RepID=A0AAD4R2R8_9BILA|nr:receptor family ligand binding region domain-containing protein [Ditylenchus destructor]
MTWRNARHAVDEWNTHTRKSALLTGDGDLPTLGLVAPSDAFGLVEHRFCDIAQRHLVAIIVPSSTDLSLDEFRLVMSMCNRFHIPCIVDRSISEEFSKSGTLFAHIWRKRLNISDKSFVISVGLKADSIGKALAQLISRLMWNSFLLLYKQPQDVVKIADLLSVWHTDNGARTSIKLLQLPGDTSQYDAFLKHIRERLRQTNIIVHTDEVSTVHTLLARASLLNMTENRYSYLFTNLDLRLLEDFFVSMNAPYRCNISGIQLVKHSPLLKTDLALTMDSVFMTGEALSSMHRRMLAPETQALLCDAGDRWQDGELLNGILKKTRLKNLTTGNLDFDPKLSGVRTNVSLLGITRRSDGKFTQNFVKL